MSTPRKPTTGRRVVQAVPMTPHAEPVAVAPDPGPQPTTAPQALNHTMRVVFQSLQRDGWSVTAIGAAVHQEVERMVLEFQQVEDALRDTTEALR